MSDSSIMAELNENKWFSENEFEFERDCEGNLFVITNDTNSEINVIKEKLPDNSATKFLLRRLKKEGVL